MGKLRTGLIIFMLMLLQSVSSYAQGYFSQLMSVRGAAMGDAYTALADDPLGIYYNPAGIAFMKRGAISYAHHIYPYDGSTLKGDSAGIVLPLGNFAMGLAPTRFKDTYSSIWYDSYGSGNETSDEQLTIAPLAIAGRFGNLAVGVSAKLYSDKYSSRYTYSGTYSAYNGAYEGSSRTTAFDVGAVLNIDKLRLGFAGQNVAGKIEDFGLIKTLRFGLAYAGDILTADRVSEKRPSYYSDTTFNYFNVGGELSLLDTIKLRGGWRIREEKSMGGPTLGLGLNLGNFGLDYAFIRFTDYYDAHKIGLSYRFGSDRKPDEPRRYAGVKIERPAPAASEPEVQVAAVAARTAAPVEFRKPGEMINVAVAEFTGKNVSQADASIVGDFLRTELVNTGLFNVMDRNNMDSVLAEQKFQNSGCTEQQCAVEMGKLLNVQQMLVGSLSKLLDIYYITVNVVDVKTGKIIASYDADAANSRELKAACKTIVGRISSSSSAVQPGAPRAESPVVSPVVSPRRSGDTLKRSLAMENIVKPAQTPDSIFELSGFVSLSNSYNMGMLNKYFQERTGNSSLLVDDGTPVFKKFEADFLFPASESAEIGLGMGCVLPPSHSIWGTYLYYGGRDELVLNPVILNFSLPMKFELGKGSGFFLTVSPDLLMGGVSGYLHAPGVDHTYVWSPGTGFGVTGGMDLMFGKHFGLSFKAGMRSLEVPLIYSDCASGSCAPLLNNKEQVKVDLGGFYSMAGLVLGF